MRLTWRNSMTAAVHSSKASEPMREAALAGAAIVENWDTIVVSAVGQA